MHPSRYWKAITGSLVAAAAVAWRTDGQALVEAVAALVATFVAVYLPANRPADDEG